MVFLLPTQLALHFWPRFAYVYGLRVDYLAPAIYLTDILLLFLIPFIRLWPKKPLVLVGLFAVLNIALAYNPAVAFFKWLAVMKLILVGLYFFGCPYRRLIRSALAASIILFACLGLVQFGLQRTVGGIFYWLGERSFSALTPGIALVKITGVNFLRAYSSFSHPNSLAGFLVVTGILVLALGHRPAWFWPGLWGLGLILTFSLGAIAGLVLALVFLKLKTRLRPHLIAALIILSFGLVFIPASWFSSNESIGTRLSLATAAIKLFSFSPLVGVGLNNAVLFFKNLQPVHNLFLLTAAETGITGLILLFGLSAVLAVRIKNKFYWLALVFVLLTGFVDHYWFTLQQNQLLLSLLVGVSLNEKLS